MCQVYRGQAAATNSRNFGGSGDLSYRRLSASIGGQKIFRSPGIDLS
jgi:hypothetical protein